MACSPRRVIGNIIVSMDGYVNDGGERGGMGWLIEHATHPQARAHFEGMYRGADTVLLGRNNYEGFFWFWPAVADNPEADKRDRDYSTWMNSVEKVVFSSTLEKTEWENSRVSRDLVNEVTNLKQADGQDIIVLSSASIIRSLIAADLLDDLHLAVVPVILGKGLQLFEGLPTSKWKLAGSTTFVAGVIDHHYQKAE